MTFERTGEAFELGEQLTVLGACLEVGDVVLEFALDYLAPSSGALETIS